MAYGYAYSILGDFHLAEDAAQEAFIQAYRDLPKLRRPEAFPGWFRLIVFKQSDRLARRRRGPLAPFDAARLPSAAPGPVEAAEKRELQEAVLDAVRSLSENERVATTLFYINGYSQKDIAEFLEVPVTTVNNRLHASRKRLKRRMIEMVAEDLKSRALPDDFARETVEQAIADAEALIGQRKHSHAEKLLRKTLKDRPRHPRALKLLNRALMQGRVYAEENWQLLPELAENGYTILASEQDNLEVYRRLADTLLAIPAMPGAIEFIEGWIRKKGPSLELLAKLAYAKGCAADYDGAESTWKELMGLARTADRDDVVRHLPHAADAIVDCLSAAGEKPRAARALRPCWELCRDLGAVRLSTRFHSCQWPRSFKQAGLEAECAAAARAWLYVVRSAPEQDASTEG